MNKDKLTAAVKDCKEITKTALQTIYDTLNSGQKKRLLKEEKVKKIFDLYEVDYG